MHELTTPVNSLLIGRDMLQHAEGWVEGSPFSCQVPHDPMEPPLQTMWHVFLRVRRHSTTITGQPQTGK